MFEETNALLACSDLFHHNGDVEPVTKADIAGRFRQMLVECQQGPLARHLPRRQHTEPTLNRLAALKPHIVATTHGFTFIGDGAHAIRDLAQAGREILGPPID